MPKSKLKSKTTSNRPAQRRLWQKMCACSGSSQTNQIRTETKCVDGVLTMTDAFYPMPTCDECGKAWEQSPPNDFEPPRDPALAYARRSDTPNMKTPTQKQIDAEIKTLESYRGKIPTGTLTDNRAALDAQIKVLKENLSHWQIYDRWPDDERDCEIRCNAMDAHDWMRGENEKDKPSKEWNELVSSPNQALRPRTPGLPSGQGVTE